METGFSISTEVVKKYIDASAWGIMETSGSSP